MFSEAIELLSDWQAGDTRVAIASALAAMACALPGNFLFVRRQSMMGDAISHTVLPGIVIAFLGVHAAQANGWIAAGAYDAWLQIALTLGAAALGILCAVLTEWIRKVGNVESSAALGVVFTSLFALGLLLMRLKADDVHLDPDCVLFGSVEALFLSRDSVPRAYWVNGSALAVNLLLVVLFFKELRLSSFDPHMATTMGFHASWLQYGLMAATAITLVAAFETVGSILVIAMLITPPATAYLLTDRFPVMIAASLGAAALAAVLGRVAAIVLPPLIFTRLGYPMVDTVSTSGMMAVAAGLLLGAAVLFGPRYGLISKAIVRWRLAIQITAQDILGRLYREEERQTHPDVEVTHSLRSLSESHNWRFVRYRLAIRNLLRKRHIAASGDGFRLTERGRHAALMLVRSHRLFESYMAKHFDLPEDHLHDTAERVEHYVDRELLNALAEELDGTERDPHGSTIPSPNDPPTRPQPEQSERSLDA